MARADLNPTKCLPIGYEAIIQMLGLEVIPHYRKSLLGSSPGSIIENGHEIYIYPKRYLPKDPTNIFSQLEFALKYDGINLQILHSVFEKIFPEQIQKFVQSQPTGKFSCRLWYLYENITGKILDIPERKKGSYVLLLDPKQYYTGKIIRSHRHFVDDNLLGNFSFCPFLRKTLVLQSCEEKKLDQVAQKIIREYPPYVISRAMHYLYMKETMSSYEIEKEQPSKQRMNRFVALLHEAENLKELTKENLIEFQNRIVDPRFQENDYRKFQNYVGEESYLGQVCIHYICPKPEDVEILMQGLLSCMKRLFKSDINPVLVAACLSFGLVFIHPFGDGNGRLHRCLIHHVLAKLMFIPAGSIFPISATMLNNIKLYNEILETFSKPLLDAIHDYTLTAKGELIVNSKTCQMYQFIDYTQIAEYLFHCIEKTIETDFKKELDYIVHYDLTKREIQEIVDMPDRKIDLIIRFVSQNEGKLSSKKKEKYFSMLTDKEIEAIERVIKENILNK